MKNAIEKLQIIRFVVLKRLSFNQFKVRSKSFGILNKLIDMKLKDLNNERIT